MLQSGHLTCVQRTSRHLFSDPFLTVSRQATVHRYLNKVYKRETKKYEKGGKRSKSESWRKLFKMSLEFLGLRRFLHSWKKNRRLAKETSGNNKKMLLDISNTKALNNRSSKRGNIIINKNGWVQITKQNCQENFQELEDIRVKTTVAHLVPGTIVLSIVTLRRSSGNLRTPGTKRESYELPERENTKVPESEWCRTCQPLKHAF